MRQCEKCDRETARRVCGLCRFDAARQVPAEVVQQLKQEAERQEAERERRRYTVRRRREMPVVIVQYSYSTSVTVITGSEGGA